MQKEEVLAPIPEPPSARTDLPTNEPLEFSEGDQMTQPTEIDFAELADGSLVDLVEDPENPTRFRFAIWRERHVQFSDRLQHKGQILRPPARTGSVMRHVRFPRGVKPYESIRSLREEIEDLLRSCVALKEPLPFVLAACALSTWVVDKLPIAPYVAVVGLPQAGKTTLLTALRLVCRRALLTADVSSAAFYGACSRFKPTLLIDEAGSHQRNAAFRHLLRMGTTRDSVAMRKNQSFSAFGPKVISWLEPPEDPALNSRCLLVPMVEVNDPKLATLASSSMQERAAELQDKLLQFRFERYQSAQAPTIPGAERLRPRTRDLLNCLSAPCAEDIDACSRLLDFFEKETWHPEPLSPAQNAVLRVLFSHASERTMDDGMPMLVLEVANQVNRVLESCGEHFRLTPKKVGAILTSFGITRRERTYRGFLVWLDRSDRERIHQLVNDHGIEGKGPVIAHSNCTLCPRYEGL